MTDSNNSAIGAGDIVTFGGYDWLVLEASGNTALIITENIAEKRVYNEDKVDITWETCTLRAYLNGEFYNRFSAQEKALIIESNISNADNQWYGTVGGWDTKDKIFLLSIEETVRYFGDSGQLMSKNDEIKDWIFDQYNEERIAAYNTKAGWWWLRSPGIRYHAAGVHYTGGIVVHGRRVDYGSGGIRPVF
jgi:hypothetical protein